MAVPTKKTINVKLNIPNYAARHIRRLMVGTLHPKQFGCISIFDAIKTILGNGTYFVTFKRSNRYSDWDDRDMFKGCGLSVDYYKLNLSQLTKTNDVHYPMLKRLREGGEVTVFKGLNPTLVYISNENCWLIRTLPGCGVAETSG